MFTRTKALSAMSYLGILCFIPLMLGTGSRAITFHARQGLVIWLWGVLAIMLLLLPFGRPIFMISSIAIMILSVIGLISVFVDQLWRLPIVFDIAERFWPSMSMNEPFHGSYTPIR